MDSDPHSGEACILVPFSGHPTVVCPFHRLYLAVILSRVDYERIEDSILYMREVPEDVEHIHSSADVFAIALEGDGAHRRAVPGYLRGILISRDGVRFQFDFATMPNYAGCETETLTLTALRAVFRP